jgi:predicted TIM-barrel fold metal-dependent hydrolase
MHEEYATLENPLMRGIGPVAERELPRTNDVRLPERIEAISADNHWEITEDIFYERFPQRLKDRAPRVWFDGYWRIGNPGLKEALGIGKNIENTLRRGLIQKAWAHDVRVKHLKAEGLKKEIVFPQSLLGYVDPDPEIRECMFRTYNDYIAEQNRKNPNFFGIGIFSNWWDDDKVQGAMDQVVGLGLKGFMVPITLRGADNKELSYADPKMDKFWATVSDAGLPVCFHVGEPANFEGRGTMATGALVAFAPYRRPISQIVFGGVLDRHPKVQVVFAEGGIGWVLPWLQDAEALYDTYGTLLDPIEHRPSYYWHKNCYATFQADELGLSRIDILGADRVMWGADYPHSEGTFGFTWKAMESIVTTLGEDQAALVLGGNAKRVFKV